MFVLLHFPFCASRLRAFPQLLPFKGRVRVSVSSTMARRCRTQGRMFTWEACSGCGRNFFLHPWYADDGYCPGCHSRFPIHDFVSVVRASGIRRLFSSDVALRILHYTVHLDLDPNLIFSYRRYVMERLLRGAPWTYSPFQHLVQQNLVNRTRVRAGIVYITNPHETLDLILDYLDC